MGVFLFDLIFLLCSSNNTFPRCPSLTLLRCSSDCGIPLCASRIFLRVSFDRRPVSDSDGASGAHRLFKARPVAHGCGSCFGSLREKSNRSPGVRGPCPPGLPSPTGGERGSPSQFPRQLKKPEGISPEPKISLLVILVG